MAGIFHFSVRRLFSQGVANSALLQPQTYPRVSPWGNGGRPVQKHFQLQPASVVYNPNAVLNGVPGSYASTADLASLNRTNAQ